MTTFYVVPTPIGNLEDMTMRSLRILGEVDVILCEDTRVTSKLLGHYSIHAKTRSFHAHSTTANIESIIEEMEKGVQFALVSDAGTPCISDPGSLLVGKIYEHFGDNVRVFGLPGPSALTTALSIAGIYVQEFRFRGFAPSKKGRETFFREIGESTETEVFYESTHRILKTLEQLKSATGDERMVIITKELTKIHERVLRGTASEVLAYFDLDANLTRGEFVVIVEGKKRK